MTRVFSATAVCLLAVAGCLVDSDPGAPDIAVGPSLVETACDQGLRARAFEAGQRQARRKIRQRWRQYGRVCDRVEPLVDSLLGVLQRMETRAERGDPGPLRACRMLGRLDGAFGALDELQSRCLDRCFLRGEVVGALAASTYCELALAGQALDAAAFVRAPVNLCGLGYELACDTSFLGETLGYAGDTGTCEPFTRDDYAAPWDATRSRVCAYENRDERDSL